MSALPRSSPTQARSGMFQKESPACLCRAFPPYVLFPGQKSNALSFPGPHEPRTFGTVPHRKKPGKSRASSGARPPKRALSVDLPSNNPPKLAGLLVGELLGLNQEL
jgi:hypothetical protein